MAFNPNQNPLLNDFQGGQMTDLPAYPGGPDSTALLEVVSPGNAASGVNYRITPGDLGALISADASIIRHSSSETTYTIKVSDFGSRLIATNNTNAMNWTVPQNTGKTRASLQVTNAGIQPLFLNAEVSKFNVFDSATGIGYTQLEVSQNQTVTITDDEAGNWIADIGQAAYSNGYEKTIHFTSYSLSNGGPFFNIAGTPTLGNTIGFDYSYDLTPGPGRNTLSFRYTFLTNTVAELETAARNLESQIKFNVTLNSILGPDNAQYFVAVQTAPLPNPQWLLAMNQVWPFNPTKNPTAVVFNSVGHTVTITLTNSSGGGAITSNLDIGSWIGLGRGTRYAGREPQAGDRIAGIFVSGETIGNSIDNHNYQPIYGSFQWTILDPTPGVAKADLSVVAGSVNLVVGNQGAWGLGSVTVNGGLLNVSANFTGSGGVLVPTGTVIAFEGPDGSGSFVNARAFGGAAAFVMQSANGTGGIPTAWGAGNILGAISYGGYNGAAAYTQSASISASTTETYTAAHSGSRLDFFTTPTTTNNLTNAMRLQPSGGLSVGGGLSDAGAGTMFASSNAGTSFSPITGTRFYGVSPDGTSSFAFLEAFGGAGAIFAGRASAGTATAPLATPAGTVLAALDGYGFTNALTSVANGAVAIIADSLWSASNAATKIVFFTTPTGLTTVAGNGAAQFNQSGGLSIGTVVTDPGTGGLALHPGSSVTPIGNGDLVVQATSNTSLTFKYKGSDGVVRSASLTLA